MKINSIFLLLSLAFLIAVNSCSDPLADEPINNNQDPDTNNTQQPVDNNANLEDAPAFKLEGIDGDDLELKNYEDKVLVIFFFGDTCPPCINIGPSVESTLYDKYKSNQKFALIGVDVWDGNKSSVEGFRNKSKTSFPLGIKGSGVGKEYGVGKDRLVVINQSGKIAFKGGSNVSSDLKDVEKLIGDLL